MMNPNSIDDVVEDTEAMLKALADLFERFPDLVEQAERNYGPDR
jgi:hypothetical protein